MESTEATAEYILHIKDADIGWTVSKRSLNLDDYDEQDKWYFNHLLEQGNEFLRVGAWMYHLNRRNP